MLVNSRVSGSFVLGDFNLTPLDLDELDACGGIKLLGEKFGPAELMPPTGPGRKKTH